MARGSPTRWAEPEDIPAITARDLRGLSDCKRQSLRVFQELRQNERGANTPIENFILSLVHAYAHFALTPEDVEREFETFCQEFEWIAEEASAFVQDYGLNPDGGIKSKRTSQPKHGSDVLKSPDKCNPRAAAILPSLTVQTRGQERHA